jgi:hypothetical protein
MSYLSLGRRLAGFSVVEEAGPPVPRGSLGRSDAANETLSRAATAEAVSITRLGRSIGDSESEKPVTKHILKDPSGTKTTK